MIIAKDEDSSSKVDGVAKEEQKEIQNTLENPEVNPSRSSIIGKPHSDKTFLYSAVYYLGLEN